MDCVQPFAMISTRSFVWRIFILSCACVAVLHLKVSISIRLTIDDLLWTIRRVRLFHVAHGIPWNDEESHRPHHSCDRDSSFSSGRFTSEPFRFSKCFLCSFWSRTWFGPTFWPPASPSPCTTESTWLNGVRFLSGFETCAVQLSYRGRCSLGHEDSQNQA